MLVVVGLSVLVMAFVMTTVVFGIRTTTANGARLDDAAAARVAITSLTKNLRAAVSPRNVNGLECSSCNQGLIQSGNAQTLTVLANIQVDQGAAGSAPKKITYRVNRIGSANFGELVEQIQDPAVTGSNFSYCVPGPGCAVRSRVLAQVPWPVTGLFSYYLADGSVATNPATSAVWSVDIVLSIDARGDSRVKPMTSTARVVLPNALAGN
jgi:hypothetical protein